MFKKTNLSTNFKKILTFKGCFVSVVLQKCTLIRLID